MAHEEPVGPHASVHTTTPGPSSSTGNPEPDMRRYLDDLETIRTLMIQSEEQPLVHHWVFFVWGLLVIAGSILTARTLPLVTQVGLDPLIVIWLPILVGGSVVETLGAILKSRDTGIPVITRRRMRLYLAAIGLVVLGGVTITHLDRVGFSTAVLIAMGATPLLIYAQATYSDLFVESYLLFAVAVIALFLGEAVETIPVRVSAGILVGIVYILGGLHSWRRETVQHRTGRPGREEGDAGGQGVVPDGRGAGTGTGAVTTGPTPDTTAAPTTEA